MVFILFGAITVIPDCQFFLICQSKRVLIVMLVLIVLVLIVFILFHVKYSLTVLLTVLSKAKYVL